MENQENTHVTEKTAAKTRRRARNILIHKPMQREFTFVMISLLMVSTLAIAFVIHQTIHDAAFGGGFQFGKINPYEVLSDVSYQLMIRVSAILFVTLVIIGVFGIFFLHRVAGPVYRFRQIFVKINDGEYPKYVRLREGDFFNETASEINRLVHRLRFEYDRDKQIKTKVSLMLDVAESSNPSVKKTLNELKEMMEQQPPDLPEKSSGKD
ncbi:MAG TPA: hypothetical protein VL688_08685 [Verrucomicrobiae bacterium]|jgi:predicted PurR-regulated permease PerM|nr:hypothetical protein [Verrucomicrobiae bacterium]